MKEDYIPPKIEGLFPTGKSFADCFPGDGAGEDCGEGNGFVFEQEECGPGTDAINLCDSGSPVGGEVCDPGSGLQM